jgi:aspartate/methionine/tyrosine aminotransferase
LKKEQKRMISTRATRLITSPPLAYITKVVEYRHQQYDEKENPEGKILLCVAENKLTSDLLLGKIIDLFQKESESIPPAILNYTSCAGLPSFRQELSSFFQKYIFNGFAPSPDHLVVGSGCVAILTSLSILLFEDNESVLIPVPYYPAFDHDFYNFANVFVFPIHCEESGTEENPFGYITEDALDRAYEHAIRAGHPPRAVLLSNPNNPMGTLYREEELRTVVKWVEAKHLSSSSTTTTSGGGFHLIMDEIYALSIFPEENEQKNSSLDRREPEKEKDERKEEENQALDRFKSVVELTQGQLGDFIHVVWSFSKDFGGSGLRVGVVYSQNENLIRAMSGATNDSMMASNLTQYCMERMIHDSSFIDNYLQENSRRLFSSYSFLKEFLWKELEVTVVRPTKGGIFVFADFRRYLPENKNSFEGENELFERLAEVGGVVLTPGESCHCPYPGFFRICYAFVPLQTLRTAMKRVKTYLLVSN